MNPLGGPFRLQIHNIESPKDRISVKGADVTPLLSGLRERMPDPCVFGWSFGQPSTLFQFESRLPLGP